MSESTRGTVVAVCLSAEGGVPKQPQPEVNVGPYGIEGDYHAGEVSRHGSGLGDLGDIRPGQRRRFSSGVQLRVTEQNNPCKNLMVWHQQVPKRLMGRRGVVCTVLIPAALRPGDAVEVDG